VNIGQREIGYGLPPYIIAELGVNHDGDVDRALALTRAAAEAGADAIKLQCFETDRLMSRASRLAAYQKAAGESDPFAMLRRLELPLDAMAKVVTLAHQLGMHAILTVFSVELVAQAQALPFDAYKTASPDLIHKPLLLALAATGKPLIVSTGAASESEVSTAATWLAQAGAEPRLAFLQCVSSYPTPASAAALGGIAALSRLTSCPVGYSDHTAEKHLGRWAVRCGARILEKHFTSDRAAPGPDHAASLDPEGFRTYVRAVRAGMPTEVEPGAPGSPESVLRFALADPDMARYSVSW
jgi:N-acetylneuraminate synthase/N,N'-diacetyllegionaminate synthase